MASDTQGSAAAQQSIDREETTRPYDIDEMFASQWFMPPAPMISLADLRKPAMVTIHVSDNGTKDSFIFVKGSLCARSAYFKRAFNGRFHESDKGEIALENDGIATSRMLNILTTWIYSGRLYEEIDSVAGNGPNKAGLNGQDRQSQYHIHSHASKIHVC